MKEVEDVEDTVIRIFKSLIIILQIRVLMQKTNLFIMYSGKIMRNKDIERRNFPVQNLSDPLKLLDKLEGYSNDQLDKMSWEDKELLLREIEIYLSQGMTPLQKYYDQLKQYFSVPSKNLLKFDQNCFYKQIESVRKAQKQEIKNIKKNAEMAARNLIDKIMTSAQETLRIEMISIIRQFEEIEKEVARKDLKISQFEKMIKAQEEEIVMIQNFNKY